MEQQSLIQSEIKNITNQTEKFMADLNETMAKLNIHEMLLKSMQIDLKTLMNETTTKQDGLALDMKTTMKKQDELETLLNDAVLNTNKLNKTAVEQTNAMQSLEARIQKLETLGNISAV